MYKYYKYKCTSISRTNKIQITIRQMKNFIVCIVIDINVEKEQSIKTIVLFQLLIQVDF